MTSPWGDMTDSEWREVKDMLGDMALENPPLAIRIVNDLRRERSQPPIREATLH